MTKSPTRESPPQANEEPPPRHRNIYDCDGEYEFPTVPIGRQTLQVGVMSGVPARLSSVARQSPLTTGGNNDFYSEFAARR